MDSILLEVEELNLWRGDAWLVRNLSFAVRGGQLLHVAGPNGSGKTTLLRALAGLTRPESGQVRWCGQCADADPDAFRSSLAWLGHLDALKPELSATENLDAWNRIRGTSAATGPALAAAGVDERAQLAARMLSAGQKRRVALARAFDSSAPLWILDEPFANLDVQGQHWGRGVVERHVADGGIAILTTHLDFDVADMQRIELGGQ